jgi:hypothetical protein
MRNEYSRQIIAQIPRLLTQIDRNPYSPTYGCCSRVYWHHRETDLPNSQAQELVLTLALAYKYRYPENMYYKSGKLKEWILAIMDYWGKIQHKNGSFDEVYINQDSFAATAFSAYAVSEALLELKAEIPDKLKSKLARSLEKAGRWLIKTKESIAMNQVCGSIATLYNIYLATNKNEFLQGAKKKLKPVIGQINPEGWLNEYCRADIGYSFLALDYLAKYYKKSRDNELLPVFKKMLDFLKYFVHEDGSVGGIYGSRNTEYISPHGLEILAKIDKTALNLANFLLSNLKKGTYSFMGNCVDDRYFMYLSANYLQAYNDFYERKKFDFVLPFDECHLAIFRESGLISFSNRNYHFVANFKKGGVFRLISKDFSYSNAGFFGVTEKNKVISTQQIADPRNFYFKDNKLVTEGDFFLIPKIVSKPYIFLGMKIYNMFAPAFLRRFFLDLLRNKVVKAKKANAIFKKIIKFEGDKIIVEDYVSSKLRLKELRLENRHISAMHFASSSFYIPQEMIFFHHKMPNLAELVNKKAGAYIVTRIDIGKKRVIVEKYG